MEVAMEPAVRFTRKDYDLLPEDLRVELIDGQLLKMPSPVVVTRSSCSGSTRN